MEVNGRFVWSPEREAEVRQRAELYLGIGPSRDDILALLAELDRTRAERDALLARPEAPCGDR